jgi:hypothetical protein
MNMKKTNCTSYTTTLLSLFALLVVSCQKPKVEPVETYPDPPAALVKFLDGAPSPAIGGEGSIVTFNVRGLKGKQPTDFTFFINQTPAEVVEVGETTVKVKVPANASTGGSAILVDGEYYFGPTFTIRGKITIDPSFNPDVAQTNGPIAGLVPTPSGFLVYGAFTNYANKATADLPITNLAMVDANGAYLAAGSQFKVGKNGVNGAVSNIIRTPDGKFLVAGSFSKIDTVGNINGIARFNPDGTLEMNQVDVINPDPVANPGADKAWVSSFNGGVSGGNVARLFYNANYGVAAIGNFSNHVSTFYERSTKDGPYLDLVKARQLIRMKESGAYDSTFNYNLGARSSYEGGNGFILDGIQLPNGKIILVGNFTTFHGLNAKRIVCINPVNGLIDPAFNLGEGADGDISRITYNNTTKKILLTGAFKNYNGQTANGVVMINVDGTRDNSFVFGTIDGGIVNYAGQLNNGRILVSGSFNKYNNIVRPGLLVLNPDGTMAFNSNNTGLFRGAIADFVESISATGIPQVTIVGNFDRFDGKPVANIVKFRIEN